MLLVTHAVAIPGCDLCGYLCERCQAKLSGRRHWTAMDLQCTLLPNKLADINDDDNNNNSRSAWHTNATTGIHSTGDDRMASHTSAITGGTFPTPTIGNFEKLRGATPTIPPKTVIAR